MLLALATGLVSWALYLIVLAGCQMGALVLFRTPAAALFGFAPGALLAGVTAGVFVAGVTHEASEPRGRSAERRWRAPAIIGVWTIGGLVPPFTVAVSRAALVLAASVTCLVFASRPRRRGAPTHRALVATARAGGLVAVAGLGGLALRFGALRFGAPHEVLETPALTGGPLRDEVLYETSVERFDTAAAVRAFALRFTAERLHFGLGHRTSFAFDLPAREGNCVEYTYLFVAVYNLAAERAHLRARAFRVRSLAPRVAGFRVPGRAFADHDWALVRDVEGGGTEYVDAAFYDIGVGADVARNVQDKAALTVPGRGP